MDVAPGVDLVGETTSKLHDVDQEIRRPDTRAGINEELKRRTLVVRIFPNAESCLRLVRALAVEIHEDWIEATRYLNMELLEEHKREQLRRRAQAA